LAGPVWRAGYHSNPVRSGSPLLSESRRTGYIGCMSQTTSTGTKRTGSPEPRSSLYDTDLYAWSLEQARLLKEGRLNEIDAENIAEEILDVGRTEYRVLESALRVLLTHIIKWDYQPERRTRSWENTIAIQRQHALRQLQKHPSLKARLDEAIAEAYADARLDASSQTDFDPGRFPERCPYDWDDIMGRDFTRAAGEAR
jgi:hypothetical protein